MIGAGIAGLSCAWLASRRRDVTLYEASPRLGGHARTVEVDGAGGRRAADTGFIVYNETNYPNFTALLRHLGVATQAAAMSFGVSIDGGALEYGSATPLALFAQPGNVLRPHFWSMLADLTRFYRQAPSLLSRLAREPRTLGQVLDEGGYGASFRDNHLLPQVGAIWSSSPLAARDHPAEPLIRFFENHGLLRLSRRPQWRTVTGGSGCYVEKLTAAFDGVVRLAAPVAAIRRAPDGVRVIETSGRIERFDAVVIAAHANTALAMLEAPTAAERRLLGAIGYRRNLAVVHDDRALMPRRRAAWSAWNHIGDSSAPERFCVSYWLNALQSLPGPDLFVTLNPAAAPAERCVIDRWICDHPIFDTAAVAAQRRLWSLQNAGGVWFCGAHFAAGFHEDALQSGLAVAEQLTGARRPWSVQSESGRIFLGESARAGCAVAA